MCFFLMSSQSKTTLEWYYKEKFIYDNTFQTNDDKENQG